MSTNTIITIGRQYGSAGRQIGRALAKELGIACYDKELLDRAAKESGIPTFERSKLFGSSLQQIRIAQFRTVEFPERGGIGQCGFPDR